MVFVLVVLLTFTTSPDNCKMLGLGAGDGFVTREDTGSIEVSAFSQAGEGRGTSLNV